MDCVSNETYRLNLKGNIIGGNYKNFSLSTSFSTKRIQTTQLALEDSMKSWKLSITNYRIFKMVFFGCSIFSHQSAHFAPEIDFKNVFKYKTVLMFRKIL